MVDILRKLYIYFDWDIQRDKAWMFFIKAMIQREIQMYIYVKHSKGNDEVCINSYIQYIHGDDMKVAMQISMQQSHQKNNHVGIVSKGDPLPYIKGIDIFSISKISYEDMKSYVKYANKISCYRATCIYVITLLCILFYIVYSIGLSWFPTSLVNGKYEHLIRISPAIVLAISISTGLYYRVYRPDFIFEVFEVYG